MSKLFLDADCEEYLIKKNENGLNSNITSTASSTK